ncbi:MAG TPA: hypothetical protein VMT03_00195, partial [Polyangia bacterium]|nr:hypothetical protein [Polyangia bacterium]
MHSERRVGEIGLGAGHRREHEAATKSRDPPRQPELDRLAGLAAHDRVKLGDVQVDDLARGHVAGAQPVPNLRHQLCHRLVKLAELATRDHGMPAQLASPFAGS